MLMKKRVGIYIIIWAIFLAIFNAVALAFAMHDGVTANFWIGYITVTAAFVLQLFVGKKAFSEDELQKKFYGFSVSVISGIALACCLVSGIFVMMLPAASGWTVFAVCVIFIGLSAASVISSECAVKVISETDKQVRRNTFTIKKLTSDAEHLYMTANDDKMKECAKRVYEAFRYSDPVSNQALYKINERISCQFAEFEAAFEREDYDICDAAGSELMNMIDERNRKCKFLK